jgi:hypothetical protein
MPEFEGSYTRKLGLRRTYAYRGSYSMDGNLLTWSAAVTCDSVAKGTPGSKISLMLPRQQDQHEHAEFMARAAIENLSDVEE